LAEAYCVNGGQGRDPDPITLEALARPGILEQVWQTWEAQLVDIGWSQAHRDQARDWLDAMMIGGIATR